MVLPLAADSDTTNEAFVVPASPSVTLTSVTDFFFNDTATTEIYTLSLHDALPISRFDRLSVRVSSGSSRTSPFTATSTVLEVWPGANVSGRADDGKPATAKSRPPASA